jgi:1-deoxy-D-xylulose-5-phosphate synthase
MADHGYSAQIKRLGIPDKYIEHGTQDELHAECNMDKTAILNAVKKLINTHEDTTSKTA